MNEGSRGVCLKKHACVPTTPNKQSWCLCCGAYLAKTEAYALTTCFIFIYLYALHSVK